MQQIKSVKISEDDPIKVYIFERLRFMYYMEWVMEIHEGMWGVPYGPTLSMVHQPIMVGLAALLKEGETL